MRKKKINRNKPMFKKKRTPARTAFNALLLIAVLLLIVFLGYSVGKGVADFMKNRPDTPVGPVEPADPVGSTDPTVPSETDIPVTSDDPIVTSNADPDPEPVPTENKKRILYVKMPENGDFDSYLNSRTAYAQENDYAGVCVDLVAVGGKICYATQNEKAVAAGALAQGGLIDLAQAAQRITDSGLVPYARVSLLTDHIVSWFDKGVCYLFENSTSTWLDDSAANGGKPWISAFSQGARDYMSSVVGEISEAGFEGIIAGEAEFPRFRNSDLNYIGASVKSADRYTALAEFSNAVSAQLGEAKSYAVEIDAQDIISGRAEIMRCINELSADRIYIKYDSAAVGTRIVKADESEVSYLGLSEKEKLTIVMKTVLSAFEGSDKTVVPAVTDSSLIPALSELGFEEKDILIY